jgi:hypothetical protein
MKQLTTITALLLISLFADNCSDLPTTQNNDPVCEGYYKNGEVLLPFYSNDTLIVVDADGLNKAFALTEYGCINDDLGDAGYDSLFHQYCIIK